jgi:DNA-directed RNA polymerase specialized sigma24 family protein
VTLFLRPVDWTLTEHALEKLLRQFDADRDLAGAKYEKLRQKLITFFECRGCRGAEDCADETINRVARRLDEGETIQAPEPLWYFLGVARNVAREHHALRERESRALGRLSAADSVRWQPQPDDETASASIGCARHCLQLLSTSERELIVDYYRGDKGTKIANRHRLASRLQVAPNALRIRAHRIRQRLEACIQSCLDARGIAK